MNDNNNDFQILIFDIQGADTTQKLGLNIFKVQEVLTCPHITHIVNSDPAMLGLIKSRDELIVLIDLSAVLFGVPSKKTKEPLIIICHGSDRKLALLVDNVSDIANTSWADVKIADLAINNNFITGFVDIQQDLISLLNLEEIMIRYLGITGRENSNKSEKLKDKNILVIDDSKWVHKVIENEFMIHGINTFSALNGQIALEQIKQQQKFDLILCDIEMPVMNGYVFLEEVGKLKSSGFSVPPIIMYSSLCDDVSTAKTKQLGASHYITKYNMTKIIHTIEQFTS